MRYFDFDSIPASTMIRHEFEDASRWTIVPYFSNAQKCVELIWTPSTVIYNYLKHCHNNLIEHNVRDAMFRLYKPKEYRQKLDIAFNDNYSISLNWTPYKAKQLTHSDVNNSIGANELTAQFIHLTLYIPFLSGLCYTKGSYQWHHKDRSKRYRLFYPVYHTFHINCTISSHRGLYVVHRDEGLHCTAGRGQHKNYHVWHRGFYRFTIKEVPWFSKGTTWKHMFEYRSFRLQFYRANDYIYFIDDDAPLIDLSTQEQVKITDRVKNGWCYG